MRSVVRAGSIAGACGLVLLSAGIARAQPIPDLLDAAVGADLVSLSGAPQGVACNNRFGNINYHAPASRDSRACLNGPVHSGNSLHGGNFHNHGNPNDSGNVTSTNGSTTSSNSVAGAAQGSKNNIQRVVKRR
ncbi:hypothetical protein [Streptomyces sp. NPDC058989]|uniref:hypothetical protein n=1 Tax=Streptomyces sp. NPDC058989 TaxID=3346686 RepID=UPI00369D16FD